MSAGHKDLLCREMQQVMRLITMKLTQSQLLRITQDLGLNTLFVKGIDKPVTNCWHFSTDGNAVDYMFYDEDDFRAGMNRIYMVISGYEVVILAFSLMDTHIHFLLYGALMECGRFVHDYIKRTSMHISRRHGESHKLKDVSIHHQAVDTESYLKTVVCYIVKNAPAGGIPFTGDDYPWSSGALYFRKKGYWSSPRWLYDTEEASMTYRQRRKVLGTGRNVCARMIDGMVFPGEFVAYEVVEKLFRTHKAYLFFMCRSKETDVDSRGGTVSHLSIPIQEMRQHRNEICRELFAVTGIRHLNTAQRLRLAKTLRVRYNSSLKQVVRLSGLVYAEVKDYLT